MTYILRLICAAPFILALAILLVVSLPIFFAVELILNDGMNEDENWDEIDGVSC